MMRGVLIDIHREIIIMQKLRDHLSSRKQVVHGDLLSKYTDEEVICVALNLFLVQLKT